MGNYIVLCGLLLCVYAMVSMLVTAMNNPLRPFVFYALSFGQAIVVGLMLYGVFISVPMVMTVDYVAFAIYCFLFLILWLLQVVSNIRNVIVPDKVYDFKLKWYIEGKNGSKTLLGTIKEGIFTTNVFVLDCTDDDLKSAMKAPLQIMLKENSGKSVPVKIYDEKKKTFHVYVYHIHTVKVNV